MPVSRCCLGSRRLAGLCRRDALGTVLNSKFHVLFTNRVLEVAVHSAEQYGQVYSWISSMAY